MDFAGPIPFKNHTDNHYIPVSVDRYSRFPTIQVYKNCDTSTAIEYLEEYCRFQGIPRSIRCDQAQAFEFRDFTVYCKDDNIKLILAPAGDHRATGMVKRLIKPIKRKLGVMTTDPLWSFEDISTTVANIIQSIRLIPNRITKKAPFEAQFGRKPNTALSNIVTKPSKQNLSNKQIKHFASYRRLLKQLVLTPAVIWDMDQDSEQELNIQHREVALKEPQSGNNTATESEDSENAPLLSRTRTPGKIIPSKLEITFRDKTSTVICRKKQLAQKTIARKATEPRGTLKPQGNIIENGTITNYSPHIITLDTDNTKNTVIRKMDLAIVTQPLPSHQKQTTPPKSIIHMVACKLLREYNNNQEKKQFCLEQKRRAKQKQQALIQRPSTSATKGINCKEEPESTTRKEKNTTETRSKHKETATKTRVVTTSTKATHNAPKRDKNKIFRKTQIQRKPK